MTLKIQFFTYIKSRTDLDYRQMAKKGMLWGNHLGSYWRVSLTHIHLYYYILVDREWDEEIVVEYSNCKAHRFTCIDCLVCAPPPWGRGCRPEPWGAWRRTARRKASLAACTWGRGWNKVGAYCRIYLNSWGNTYTSLVCETHFRWIHIVWRWLI